jgi:hypothetical protein
MAIPEYFTGDTWPPLSGTVKDASDAAVNISGATSIRMIAKRSGGTEVIAGTATIVDDSTTPNRGKWTYEWASSDLSVAGSYVPEIEVTWPGGPPTRIETFRTDSETFTVKADND